MSRRPSAMPSIAITLLAAVALASCSGDSTRQPSASPRTSAVTFGALTISDAVARPSANDVGVIYFTVTNHGAADRLTRVTSSFAPMVQLHREVVNGASSTMQPVDAIDVPADGSVRLEPGGYHVMLMNLDKPLVDGISIAVLLTFEKAGTVSLEVPVRRITVASGS